MKSTMVRNCMFVLLIQACAGTPGGDFLAADGTAAHDGVGDAAAGDASKLTDPFVDRLVSFEPGPGATFGQDKLPGVVFGPPQGHGNSGGGLDVVSLGQGGTIVLAFEDIELVDGPGVDLLVFENPFSTWIETGVVAVSSDGVVWHEWPCAAADAAHGWPGCAGVHPVLANPDNGIDPTDGQKAGGDGFDLADLGVTRARFVRIRDSGANSYAPPAGGFDLDAIAIVHGAPVATAP